MSEHGGEGRDREQVAPLLSAFLSRMDAKSEVRAPTTVNAAVNRFGWSTRDLAREMGVSERTARRWKQFDKVPERKAERFRDVVKSEAARRQRQRIERRGLSGMRVEGTYRISRSRYKARQDYPVRFGQGEKLGTDRITPAQMREVFGALDRGELADAEQMFNDALGEAYGAPGLSFEEIDDIDYEI